MTFAADTSSLSLDSKETVYGICAGKLRTFLVVEHAYCVRFTSTKDSVNIYNLLSKDDDLVNPKSFSPSPS